MPEKIIGWPRGTEINNYDGKRHIILRPPRNMNKFSRKELALEEQASKNNNGKSNDKSVVEVEKINSASLQFSGIKEKVSHNGYRKIPRRQDESRRLEEIRIAKGQEREFKEKQKKFGAKNYHNIWER